MTMHPEPIASAANPLIKLLKSLERKKARSETGLFLAEGARLVQQGLDQSWTCEHLAVAASMADRPALQDLIRRAQKTGARTSLVRDGLMEKITHKDNAQSTIAAFRQRALGLVDLPAPRGPALYLALWKVRDPGNLGTILRTADCAGASGVLLLEQCCDPYSFETVRASMGSLFDIPFVKCGWDEFRRWQKKERLYLAAASMHGKARHDRSDLAQPLVLLMGNEQQGLPGEQEQACDALIRIPMRGGADSLNLAQAAGILTYEAWRQRDFR